MSGRVPPHDLDAEAAVISAALLDSSALDEVAYQVAPSDFYAEAHRRTWEAALDLWTQGKPVDIVTVAGWLRDRDRLQQVGGAEYLARLVDAVPSVAHVEQYAQIVRGKARARKMIAECSRIAAEGYGELPDVKAYLDAAERDVFAIASSDGERNMRTMLEIARETARIVHDAHARGGRPEVPTGLVDFDKFGGLKRTALHVIAARPGMGKTALLGHLADAVASSGKAAPIFSLEMRGEDLVARFAAARAGVSVDDALAGRLNGNDQLAFAIGLEEVRKLPVAIDDTPAATLLHIRARARRIAATQEIGAIFVDYLQLMGVIERRKGGNREEEVAEFSRGLKQIAKELNVPVVALSQLNRKCEERSDKRPQLSDLRESGAIEQDSDQIVFLYRQQYYDRANTKPEDVNVAELIVAKNRNGPTGTARVGCDMATMKFRNLTGRAAPNEYGGGR